jgi:hypothetical protein
MGFFSMVAVNASGNVRLTALLSMGSTSGDGGFSASSALPWMYSAFALVCALLSAFADRKNGSQKDS